MNNILVIAPHADDEVLGCGGVIRKFVKQGKKVSVLIVTNAHVGDPERYSEKGIANVRSEAKAAHEYLGVSDTFYMDFPAPRLDTFPAYKISTEINSLILKKSFDTVFVPHRGDIHKDHRIVFEATLVACRPIANCPVREIYAYETLSETEWSAPFADDAFHPNVFIELSEDEFSAKQSALSFFKSQIKEFPASRSNEAVEALAKYRGSTIYVPRAEAFMLVRQIIS